MMAIARIRQHLERTPSQGVPPELRPDLETLRRRCAIARRLGHDVELSPWMKTLLRISA